MGCQLGLQAKLQVQNLKRLESRPGGLLISRTAQKKRRVGFCTVSAGICCVTADLTFLDDGINLFVAV